LQKHKFYEHIFPQITKFFGFFRSPASQNDLVEKLFSLINTDVSLKGEFKRVLGDKEIYKFLKDICERSQNILLVVDGDKRELPEIKDIYRDTWGELVKVLVVKNFTNGKESLISVDPDFVDIQYASDAEIDAPEGNDVGESSKAAFTEEYHLDGVSDSTKQCYTAIKTYARQNYPNAVFNCQKQYIGIRTDRNLAYLKLQKKSLRAVIMLPEEQVRSVMVHHIVISLSQSVQGFYNGPCCAVKFEDAENMDEFWKILSILMKKP
jgi:predicted transport protein